MFYGTNLKNTEWALAICVYTGINTRLMLNSQEGKLKRSNLDQTLNHFIVYIMIFQSCICIIVACIAAYYHSVHTSEHSVYIQYDIPTSVEGVFSYFRYLLLMGTMIPISLIVSLECCKLVQSSYIIHDANMFTREPKREHR